MNDIGNATNKKGNTKDDLLWDYGTNEQVFSRDSIITYGITDIFDKKCHVNDCGRQAMFTCNR